MAAINNVIEDLVELIEKQEWAYTRENDKPVLQMTLTGKNGHWRCIVIAGRNEEHATFLSIFPCIVPASRRSACGELINRINFGLTHGCFELDIDDGELRFRTCIPVLNGHLPPEAAEYLVFANLAATDRFFATIVQVIFANVSPKDALREPPAPQNQPRFELN